jgi:tmRNA-binding protein
MPSYAKNKYVHHDYEVLETIEAGLVLSGAETKAIRTETTRLKSSYISLRKTRPGSSMHTFHDIAMLYLYQTTTQNAQENSSFHAKKSLIYKENQPKEA